MWHLSENCNLMRKFNCLGGAAKCCEYFQHRREESIIRYAAYRYSVILTGDPRIHYPPMGTAVIFTEKPGVRGTSITSTALDPQRYYSTSWSGKITLLFPVPVSTHPGRRRTGELSCIASRRKHDCRLLLWVKLHLCCRIMSFQQ